MNIKKIIAGASIAIASVIGFAGCNRGQTTGGAALEHQRAQQQLTQLAQSDPIPSYTSSQLRKNLIDIENIQANATQTTSFFMQLGNPDPIFSCTSVGLPLSVDDQLTNPQQIVRQGLGNGYYADGVVGQIDPTGVYSGSSSSGTNVVCVDKNGRAYDTYWEGDVLTFTYGATWDRTTHSVNLIGSQPTAQIRSGN